MTTIIDQALTSSFPEPNKMGGWNFLQTLTTNNNGGDVPYLHPLEKRSKSVLTEKGLEMCTETLGNETGCDVAGSDFPVSFSGPSRVRSMVRAKEATASAAARLPPPLPSISGVHVESVREGGRLVMRAVAVGPAHTCFEAQRDNGRLTLRFAKASDHHDGDAMDYAGEYIDGINYEEEEGDEYARAAAVATTASSSRCNEENTNNRDMLFAEAFWVATS